MLGGSFSLYIMSLDKLCLRCSRHPNDKHKRLSFCPDSVKRYRDKRLFGLLGKATATRELADLVQKLCLLKLPGGGRSTRDAAALDARNGPCEAPKLAFFVRFLGRYKTCV